MPEKLKKTKSVYQMLITGSVIYMAGLSIERLDVGTRVSFTLNMSA